MRPETGEKNKTQKEFNEILLEVRRVTRVTTGGRRLSFRATVLVGNKKGKIGIGLSKGNDVTSAVKKASNEAYKNMFLVPITKADTVPYPISLNYKACFVKLLPASAGTGLKAGSSVRSVLELAGYGNVLSKIVGSNNKLNNAIATIMALAKYKHADHFNALHEKKSEKSTEVNSEEELDGGESKVLTTVSNESIVGDSQSNNDSSVIEKKSATKNSQGKSFKAKK